MTVGAASIPVQTKRKGGTVSLAAPSKVPKEALKPHRTAQINTNVYLFTGFGHDDLW